MRPIPITVAVKSGLGWAPLPVPAAEVVSAIVQDENPETVGRYDLVPTGVAISTQTGPDSPNGSVILAGGSDGTWGVTIWALTPPPAQMHRTVREFVAAAVLDYDLAKCRVLEIGAYNVNGTCRDLFDGTYIGVDRRDGPGVDEVASGASLPFSPGTFDVVLYLETLEHDPTPWRTLAEIYRVLIPSGVMVLTCRGWDGDRCAGPHTESGDYWRPNAGALTAAIYDAGLWLRDLQRDTEGVGYFAVASRTRQVARIVCPFVAGMLRDETRDALLPYGAMVRWWELDPTDAGGYATLIETVWAELQTTVVVEQDIAPTWRQVFELVTCDRPWCYHAYDDRTGDGGPLLGLAKLSVNLLYSTPEVGATVLRTDRRHTEPVPWQVLDTTLARHLMAKGERPHLHRPRVRHLHSAATAPGDSPRRPAVAG